MADTFPTLTLPADQWRKLFAPVLPHTSDEDTLPVLNAIHLRITVTHALASATDRFTMATQRVPIPAGKDDDPQTEFAVLIDRADVRTFLDAHPEPAGAADDCECYAWTETRGEPPVTLTYDAAHNLVRINGSRRLVFHTEARPEGYPKLDKIFADLIRRNTTAAPPSIFLTAWMFERWQQVDTERARLYFGDEPKSHILVTVGEDFIGAWAPCDPARLPEQPTPLEMWGEQYPDKTAANRAKVHADAERIRAEATAGGAA